MSPKNPYFSSPVDNIYGIGCRPHAGVPVRQAGVKVAAVIALPAERVGWNPLQNSACKYLYNRTFKSVGIFCFIILIRSPA